MRRRSLLGLAAVSMQSASSAWAVEGLAGPVVLTVSSRQRDSQRDGQRTSPTQFDMAALASLPQTGYTTHTPWYSQPRKFTGPLLRDVLASAGVHGSQLRLVALNDYRVDLPFDDVLQHEVLLARLMDDKPMAVRDKGPLFVIYPFDQHAALRNAVYYSRCAWQLRAIDVL